MAQMLQGIPGVVYFIDDILVTGCTGARSKLAESLGENQGVRITTEEVKVSIFSKGAGIFGSPHFLRWYQTYSKPN